VGLKIRKGRKILFIGDSITDCGRRAEHSPLGCGYVKMFADLAIIREPEKTLTIINKGIGGDRVPGLRERWSDDVLRHKPDWLSVKIGINDLHSVLRQCPVQMVYPKVFREAYDDILGRTRARLPKCNILLIDPFFISVEKSKTSFRRDVLDLIPQYINVVHAMARKYKTRLVKTHDMFAKLLKSHEADTFCPEPVHPNPTGHLAIAEAVYGALSK